MPNHPLGVVKQCGSILQKNTGIAVEKLASKGSLIDLGFGPFIMICGVALGSNHLPHVRILTPERRDIAAMHM